MFTSRAIECIRAVHKLIDCVVALCGGFGLFINSRGEISSTSTSRVPFKVAEPLFTSFPK